MQEIIEGGTGVGVAIGQRSGGLVQAGSHSSCSQGFSQHRPGRGCHVRPGPAPARRWRCRAAPPGHAAVHMFIGAQAHPPIGLAVEHLHHAVFRPFAWRRPPAQVGAWARTLRGPPRRPWRHSRPSRPGRPSRQGRPLSCGRAVVCHIGWGFGRGVGSSLLAGGLPQAGQLLGRQAALPGQLAQQLQAQGCLRARPATVAGPAPACGRGPRPCCRSQSSAAPAPPVGAKAAPRRARRLRRPPCRTGPG